MVASSTHDRNFHTDRRTRANSQRDSTDLVVVERLTDVGRAGGNFAEGKPLIVAVTIIITKLDRARSARKEHYLIAAGKTHASHVVSCSGDTQDTSCKRSSCCTGRASQERTGASIRPEQRRKTVDNTSRISKPRLNCQLSSSPEATLVRAGNEHPGSYFIRIGVLLLLHRQVACYDLVPGDVVTGKVSSGKAVVPWLCYPPKCAKSGSSCHRVFLIGSWAICSKASRHSL